jgi:mono/diheme cytochrome c family protein
VRRRGGRALFFAALAGAAVFLAAEQKKPPKSGSGAALPQLGTVLRPLPDGSGKSIADGACVACHSADIIRQQRLTEKQWQATVTKMTGWGAPVDEKEKDALIAYLVQNFGPDNDRFQPVVARPAGH